MKRFPASSLDAASSHAPGAVRAPALLAALFLLFVPLAGMKAFEVDPAASVIVLPAQADKVKQEAAAELQKHLRLVTGAEVAILNDGQVPSGKYPFHVGIALPDDKKPLAPEEARWVVTPEGTSFYGNDDKGNGTLFAVYDFLEDELGIRWIEPGEKGIAFVKQSPLRLSTGEHSWAPELLLRKIRTSWRRGQPGQIRDYVKNFADFLRPPDEHDAYADEVALWQKRMRMGGHDLPGYGHAFTTWWKQYGATHPEYFALKENGKREPDMVESQKFMHTADNPKGFQNIKLCPGNPAVAEQIVKNWVAAGRRTPWINVCENDVPPYNYCVGEECTKLDVPAAGEKPMEHLTDRYVHLANEVAREARKIDPKAGAVMFAYDRQLQPPRREKVDPNVALAVVPTTTDLEQLETFYQGWENAGAKLLMLRPNYHTYFNTLVIPAGFEEHMFNGFQTAYRHGARAADYDSLVGHWPVTGLSDYVLARALSDPQKPFQHWVDQYCSAFGAASDDVKQYYDYWRNEVWNKRLYPNLNKIVEKGKYFNFARGLMWSLRDYYQIEDFDRTDAILKAAAQKDLTETQRQKLEALILANQHARLTYKAITSKGQEQFAEALRLLDFRKAHKNDLHLNWIGLFSSEARFGDVTGLGKTYDLKDYPLPWIDPGVSWRFKMDPENAGLKEKWQDLTWEETGTWDNLRTDSAWEAPYDSETDPQLAAKLKNYDGIAWYSTRVSLPKDLEGKQIFLYFGSVDESCWVYVNGEEAGAHVFKDGGQLTPFTIEIGKQIDWNKQFQNITVRVEDKGGLGGITSRVWVVSKKPDEKPSAN